MMRSALSDGIAGALVAIAIGALVTHSAAAQTVPFATIAVGNGPASVVADPANGKLFVVNTGSNTISVIDAATRTKVADIPTGGGPRRIRLDDQHNKLYVNNSTGDSITVIDRASNAVIGTITLPPGSRPWDIDLYGFLTVVMRDSNQLALVDTATDTVRSTFPTGQSPVAVCGGVAVNSGSDEVSVYLPRYQGIETLKVGKAPGSCVAVFGGGTNYVYVANADDATVSPILMDFFGNGGRVENPVPSGNGPLMLTGNLYQRMFVVGNTADGTATIVDSQGKRTLPTGANPSAALIDSDANALYVANRDANTVSVIDLFTYTVQQQVPVGANPESVDFDRRVVYVANQSAGGAGGVSLFKRFNFRPALDSNRDGRSDIAMRNAATQQTSLFYMNGVVAWQTEIVTSATGVPILRAVLLRDAVTNLLTIQGHEQSGIPVPDTMQPLLAVDCIATGMRCIVARDTATGKVAYWSVAGWSTYPLFEQTVWTGDKGWVPVLAGDLDGDGYEDIVWRHTDGSIAAWLMTGTPGSPIAGTPSSIGVKSYKLLLGSGTDWVPERLGDFDGDGHADILWRNTTTGETAIWLMNGLDAKSYASVHSGTAGWRVTNVRDLDGDQKDDLVWRSATGETAAWLMDGLAAKPGGMSVLLGDPNWRVTHTQFTAVSPRSSLIWRNDVTGETAVWTMNGLTLDAAAYLSHDPDWVVVPPE
jgi:YVTN family beta-propeller protein